MKAEGPKSSGFFLSFNYGYAMSMKGDFKAPTGTDVVASTFNDNVGASPMFGIEFGYAIIPDLKLSLEVGFHNDHKMEDDYQATLPYFGLTDIHSAAEVSTFYGMLNVVYDIPFELATIKPFIGAGAGYASTKVSDQIMRLVPQAPPPGMPAEILAAYKPATTNSFAWQLQVGLIKKLTNNLDLSLEYRYQSLGDVSTGTDTYYDITEPKTTEASKGKFNNHLVALSFIYNF